MYVSGLLDIKEVFNIMEICFLALVLEFAILNSYAVDNTRKHYAFIESERSFSIYFVSFNSPL